MRRSWVRVEMFGETHTIAGWSRIFGHNRFVVYARMERGMDLLTALRTGAKPKKRITINGQTRTTKQWAQHLGMTPSGFRTRMLRGGDESKLVKPHQRRGTITAFGRTQSLVAWSRETGIHKGTLFTRIRSGLPPEMALTIPIDTSRKRK